MQSLAERSSNNFKNFETQNLLITELWEALKEPKFDNASFQLLSQKSQKGSKN